MFDFEQKKVFVAGHKGMVGSAVVRALENTNIYLQTASRDEVDLTKQAQVESFFASGKPEVVIICAAKVGGIFANSKYPADFIYDNLALQTNIIEAAYRHEVSKLIFLGSSCIYPKFADQPINEDELLNGKLEPTNESYAIAKIAGIKLCEAYRQQHGCDFISVMPTNLYGLGDNFDLQTSHVIPALMRKFHEAKMKNEDSVVIWGTGNIRREFLHVDDCAKGILHLLRHYSDIEHVNLGSGEDHLISDIALMLKQIVQFEGKIVYDTAMPEGTPRKLLDVSKIKELGWQAEISLRDGLEDVYMKTFC